MAPPDDEPRAPTSPSHRTPPAAARASGLVRAGEPLLVLLSGGADSVCLLAVAVELEARVSALHVDYGLRPSAAADADFCRSLCERMGVPLTVERPSIPRAGNVQAWARDVRYSLAESLAVSDYASGHTLSDQVETVLYRLAVSPGRRALLGMQPRRGRLVRPLLAVTREEVRDWCRERKLVWREDPTNEDRNYARARVRRDVVPALRVLNPAAERVIAETAAALRDEHEVLEDAVGQALERLGPAPELALLRREPKALARLVLARLAGVPVSREAAARLLALDARGTRELDMGRGVRAVVEYGHVRFTSGPDAPAPDAVALDVPGRVRFGEWEVEAAPGDGGEAVLSADQLGPSVTVRGWRSGDRIRPAGLGGTKSLQDLLTDRKVPRGLRRSLPVVEANGEIVWVAGVAAVERAAGTPVSLTARRVAV